MNEDTDCPDGEVIYELSAQQLEELPVYETLQNTVCGGVPIQIGYCNG